MSEIQKLQRKFVAINMTIVTVILLLIGVFFVVSTADSLRSDSYSVLNRVLTQNDLPAWNGGRGRDDGVTLPYFTVSVWRTGQAAVTSSQFYELEEEAVTAIVEDCLAQEENSGVLEDYDLRYLRKSELMGWELAFVDISQERSTLANAVRTTLIISLVTLAAFFLISIRLSRWAVGPVEQSWKQQRQFVADASHELKTPLTVILSNVEMLQRYGEVTEQKDLQRLDNLHSSALQMKDLVEELLLLARSDSNSEQKAPHQQLNFSDLVEDTALQFDAVIFESGRNLYSVIAPELYVSGEEGKLRRLVEILLDNARKYSTPGGEIVLSLQPEGNKRLRLQVTNAGEAIPPAQLERIFERFYRADQARSSEGFGLGLPIARTIVEEHGGKIWAESAPGENRFCVTLPRLNGGEKSLATKG
jgi:signal transduction histidine kinase